MNRHHGWSATLFYLTLVAIISCPLDFLLVSAGRLDIGRGFPIHLLMWAPGLAALATCRILRIDFSFLGLSRFAWKATSIGYAIVAGYSILTFAGLWTTGLAPLSWQAFAEETGKLYDAMPGAPVLAILFTATFGIVQSAASALGEEIGWRGFLVPALANRMSKPWAFLISGLIWAVWHFPLTIFSDYGGGTPLPFQLACFTLMIVSTGAIYGMLRLASGSVWPAVVMHAAHNALIQWLLDPMTVETGRPAWFAGEFGLGLATVTAVIAVGMLAASGRRGRKRLIGGPGTRAD